jgi:hypothetical protein
MFQLFHRNFLRICWDLRALFLAGLGWFMVGGIIISWVEKMPFSEAIYFAFITGLTVGYGDIAPNTNIGRITAVLLAIVGIMLSGLIVAACVQAVKIAWEQTHTTHSGK